MSGNWKSTFESGLEYTLFLDQYGTPPQRERWAGVYDRVVLKDEQRRLLSSFVREMRILCLAGAWCGDCVNQCPILARFAEASPKIRLRFLDRDAHVELADTLMVNAGRRVPVVVFLSEDFYETGRYGDRTLSIYRQMARDQLGPACPTGIGAPSEDLLAATTEDWLREVERHQLLLRLSPRLRAEHGD